jgi:hypothetical protein
MDLVAIPTAPLGNYRLHVRQIPRESGSGVRALRVEIRDPATSERVAAFSPLHERLLHLFIVRRDLEYFSHVHPELRDDAFEAIVDLDAGAYVLIADFAPAAGAPQLVHRAIVTPGYKGSPFTSAGVRPDLSPKTVDGVKVGLEGVVRLLKPSALTFSVHDAETNQPVDNLEPFLGASGHLLVVNADLTVAMHAHPESATTEALIRPQVTFAPTFGAPGVYKMWVQFQRVGKVITAPFAVDVK